jgi:hypothetical protein
MERPQNPIPLAPFPAEEGCFTWSGFLVAILIAPLFGSAWAWAAEVAQSYFAPLILFPALVGVFAGLSVVALVRFAQIGHRPTILLAALLTAAVAAAGQHCVAYLNTYYGSRPSVGAAAEQDVSALFREMTPSFGAYMHAQAGRGRPLLAGYVAHGWMAWLTWAMDGLLVAAAAVAVTIPAMRVPYCNRCRTWYRSIRSGRIDLPTTMRLAELAGVDEIGHPHSPRYRLLACQSGCGPTRCELSWEESYGAVSLVRVWLDAEGRNQVAAILDSTEAVTSKSNP